MYKLQGTGYASASSAEEGTPKRLTAAATLGSGGSFNLLDMLDEQHFIAPFVVDQFVDDLLGD